MFKNYFYLQRAVTELLPVLLNVNITECYSQEKDRLYFTVPTDNSEYRHLIISTNPTLPYLQIRKIHHKARKNTVIFFNEYFPAVIRNIQIAENDRTIKFSFDNFALYFLLHGNKSNILLIDNNNASSFKHPKTVDSQILSELSYIDFSSEYKLTDYHIKDLSQLEYSQFKQIFPFIDKTFFQEIVARLDNITSRDEVTEQLQSAIDKIQNDNITVFYDDFASKTYFMPDTFLFCKNADNKEIADNYNDAIQLLFRIKFKNERIKSLKNQIRKHLDKELNRYAYKLNNLSGRIEKGSRENYYYKLGNLLLANINLLKKGMGEIELSDYDNDTQITIPLYPKLLPNKNVDKYFEKAKDEKINFQKSKELFEKTERIYNSLLNLKTEFDAISTVEDLEEMANRLKLKKGSKVKKIMINNIKFRHFIIENKYNVYVGKDSKSNDLLSVKFAKQNDYWFHARGLPGSHVVLRVENTKEGVPKNIIKNAASIAGFYSKAKTAKVAPVSYTFAKYVYKKKGMEPGKVMISKEKVLLVKPEIPKNCEIVNDE